MADPTITPPPEAPNRDIHSNDTFSTLMDGFLGWLTGFRTELVTLVAWISSQVTTISNAATAAGTSAEGAATAASGAAASAAAAAVVSGATLWVSEGSYTAIESAVISPLDLQTYRAKTTHSGVDTDPSLDSTNWAVLGIDGSLLDAKANLDSPNFSGTPTVPTAAPGTSTTQAASTAFVRGEMNSMLDGAPAALDTFNELAAALNDDANFAATVTTQLGLKANSSGVVPKTGGAFTGTVTLKGVAETVKAFSGTTAYNISPADGTVFTLTTSGNTTLLESGSFVHGFTLIVTMGGNHTITWPASFNWGVAGAPVLPASGQKFIVTGFTPDNGVTYFVAKVWGSS